MIDIIKSSMLLLSHLTRTCVRMLLNCSRSIRFVAALPLVASAVATKVALRAAMADRRPSSGAAACETPVVMSRRIDNQCAHEWLPLKHAFPRFIVWGRHLENTYPSPVTRLHTCLLSECVQKRCGVGKQLSGRMSFPFTRIRALHTCAAAFTSPEPAARAIASSAASATRVSALAF